MLRLILFQKAGLMKIDSFKLELKDSCCSLFRKRLTFESITGVTDENHHCFCPVLFFMLCVKLRKWKKGK